MSDEQTITIEVDGRPLTAKPGQMLIEVTDAAGISVPRFCYHKKLSVAANCRMCLVEVEKAPKPLPACATPVADGMKVYTRSPLAREAQKGTMEFLLINHPLDCPICDQGGECELQDVAMGYGGDVSRFSERKRVVKDEDIGALIATDMTRCIHCTRCVRFGGEIAGLRELGATGRGEHMRIGVFVEQAVASELSGNVIDLCPVGALTSKPYRYTARAWELLQRDGVAAHDAVGSNLHVHVRRNQVMRVVPRENEAINETWISDRDRFSYQGLYTEDRLEQPLLRSNGKLRPADWQEALQATAKLLKGTAAGRLGALVSPNATLEEMYLLQALVRGLGSANVDHRLRQSDFRNAAADPRLPWLGLSLADLERNQATLLVGSWLRKEQPLVNHRLRKSVLAGGSVMAINPVAYDFNYDLDVDIVATPSAMLAELAGVAAALGADTLGLVVAPDAAHQAIADALRAAEQGSVLLGSVALAHPDFTLLRGLADSIAAAADVSVGYLNDGANAAGAWLAGAVPHRGPGGAEVAVGLDAAAMLAQPLDSYILLGCEPDFDLADPARAQAAFGGAQLVALATHLSPALQAQADVVLPVAGFAETSGTFVNLQGDRQSFAGAVSPVGEARPAWKVLRVLGNLVDLEGFEFVSSEEVRDTLLGSCGSLAPDNRLGAATAGRSQLPPADGLERIGGVSMYAADPLVRRARALQSTPDAWRAGLRVNAAVAASFALAGGDTATLRQGAAASTLPVVVDERVPDGCVWLPSGVPGTESLAAAFGHVSLEKA
jgi:NADH-quinone oxidoreductase subunit G